MKRIIFILLMQLLPFANFASDNHSIDSLEIVLRKHPAEDTVRLNTLIDLAKTYRPVNLLKAFDNIKTGLKLAEKLNDKKNIGRCLNSLGDFYWYSGDYTSASNNYFDALKIYDELKDPNGMADCYRNIGWIYQGQENYPLTIEYYKKSLDLDEKNGFKNNLISNYDDLGIVYKLMGDYPKALEYCKKAIAISKELNVESGVGAGYGNLGDIYFKMGKYEESIQSILIAITIHQSIKDYYNCTEDYAVLSQCYLKHNQPAKAIEYTKMALELSKQQGYRNNISNGYAQLAEAYAMQKDYLDAYTNLNLYTKLRDSTYNEKNSLQINEMSAKYESEKKELTINSLEKDNAQDKKFRVYLIVFIFMIAVFTLYVFRSFLQNKKANKSLSLAYKEIEVKNKDITDSINYAKQIQRARLPNPSVILNHLPESFGLYKPKDVVSGDFYWFAEHENGKLMLVAADCTGHGIPGAFMSLIGIDELNHASLEKRLDNASEILSSVNKGVKKALRQNEQNSMSRDGMDLALCILDLKNNKLEYAGANRPLYYIRDNQLIEITPTKAAIGGLTPNDQEFKNHTIDIKKGDMIYVFTDGFADQFGGSEGKKFMTKRFKEMLLSIHQKPATEQEAILEKALNEWKKDISQVDDILVLGIRI